MAIFENIRKLEIRMDAIFHLDYAKLQYLFADPVEIDTSFLYLLDFTPSD